MPHWKKTINGEIDSIMQNHSWKLVNLSHGNKPLGTNEFSKRN